MFGFLKKLYGRKARLSQTPQLPSERRENNEAAVDFEYLSKARASYQKLCESNYGAATIYAERIAKDLKRAKAGYKDLDQTGQSTEDEMKAKVISETKRGMIVSAQYNFKQMESSSNPEALIEKIEEELKSVGVGYEALDPNGEKSAKEMEFELKKVAKARRIEKARSLYAKVCNSNYGAGKIYADEVTAELKRYGASYKDLDPTGQSTEQEMKAKFDEETKQSMIRSARNMFDGLQTASFPDTVIKKIAEELSSVGAGYETLDSKGKKTAEEMKAEIKGRMKENRVAKAQNAYTSLLSCSFGGGDLYLQDIVQYLHEGEASYKDLDPTGQSTDEEMAAKVKKAKADAIVRYACFKLDKIKRADFPEKLKKEIIDDLRSVSVGYSALDPTGEYSDIEMEIELDKRTRDRSLELAKNSFDWLTKTNYPDQVVISLKTELKQSGCGYDMLDPTQTKTDEEMRAEVERRRIERKKQLKTGLWL